MADLEKFRLKVQGYVRRKLKQQIFASECGYHQTYFSGLLRGSEPISQSHVHNIIKINRNNVTQSSTCKKNCHAEPSPLGRSEASTTLKPAVCLSKTK